MARNLYDFISKVLFVCAISGLVATAKDSKDQPSQYKSKFSFRVGDPRLCLETGNAANIPVNRFEVLPGVGWDNLQNIPKGQVIAYNYSKCLTTDDGKYLIPDQVFTIPLKESHVDTFAELIDSWHDTSSITSNSINVNAGLQTTQVSISGSFSHEHTQIKQKQFEDKAVTVRVQLRYERYKSLLQPNAELHPACKRRLMIIAGYLQLNHTQMARYEADLFIRDFGTHYLTSMVAGAGLSKTDFIKKEFMANNTEDKRSILVSASIGFGKLFHVGSSFGHSTDNKDYESYTNSTTHSFVTSHGGPLMQAYNMTVDDWTKKVDMELVPMDKTGDPLSYLVNQWTIPELPINLVHRVEKLIERAIVHYYEMNAIHGCTKLDSPNFSFSANIDDGSCDKNAKNGIRFGGVYQTCTVSGSFIKNNPCNGLNQVNPKTRANSCPESYTAVKLVTAHKTGAPEYERKSYSCGFFSTCHYTVKYLATATYTTYWCAALGEVDKESGYLFGGIYSDNHVNILTGTKRCPAFFYAIVFLDYKICISDDFELAVESSVPLGGFMSCTEGNPLGRIGSNQGGSKQRNNSLSSFMSSNESSSRWPKHCPQGYSQHLALIASGCEVMYCIESGALKHKYLPKIKLPPFHSKPHFNKGESKFIYNPETQEWIKNKYTYEKTHGGDTQTWSSYWSDLTGDGDSHTDHDDDDGSSKMDPALAAAIGVIVTTCCGVVALTAYKLWQRRRIGKGEESGVRLRDADAMSELQGEDNYGTLNNQQSSDTVTIGLPTNN